MAQILHVDMDAFFASVELLDHPEWRGKPLIVGSLPNERGVVSTCSYEARRYGVHSAMPSRTAYQRCPHAVFVRPRMERYLEISARAFEVFSDFTPYVEGVSVDEAFLHISGSVHLYGSAEKLGNALREAIKEKCGVTCSVGIANNRLLAKIGSEENKPDGLTMMPVEAAKIVEFLAPKPIGVLWGIGKKTAELLKPYGITLCRHVQRLDVNRLATILGSVEGAAKLIEYAHGISDDTVYWQAAEEKSVSREHTFDSDCYSREDVKVKLLELVTEVGRRFRSEERWGRTARIKLRDTSFNTITRQLQFPRPSRDDISFRKAALELFEREKFGGIRLVGFGVSDIQTELEAEPMLFEDQEDKRLRRLEKLSETIDALRDKGMSVK